MNIIIPLGGKGERFKKEGYLLPKPLIKVLNKEILYYTLDNLDIQQNDNVFIIYNNELDNYDFKKIIENKYPFIHLIKLDNETKGAAETIYIGLDYIIKNKNTIYNNIKIHLKTILIDGDAFYTENILDYFRNINEEHNAVFYIKNEETKPVYSYIKLNNENKIIDIQEKNKISDNANTGAYAFNNIDNLYKYAKYIIDNNITFKNEPYISCIINEMIKKDEYFKGIELNEEYFFVLGTPIQVKQFINRTKLFLFDLDGTLILTDNIYYSIWYDILLKYNIYLEKDIFHNYIQGNTDINVINKLLPNIDINISDISILKENLFNQNINKIKIIEGSIDFLKKIKKYGHKIIIVTNCNRINAENIIKKININYLIDDLIIGNECSRSKPYPDPYIKACKLFNKKSSDVFIFEDSKSGILSGRSTNPKCLIGIETIFNKKDLYNLGVNIAINNYNEIEYNNLITFTSGFYNSIKKYIKNCINKNNKNNDEDIIQDIIIFDEKLKGGYISDVLKIKVYYKNKEELNCIIKLENNNETNLSIMAKKLGLYEREYYFYENISKYVPVNIPLFYGLIKDDNLNNIGFLMEDLNKDNFKINLNLNTESINISLKIIEQSALLHSHFWNKDLSTIFPGLIKNNNKMFNPVWSDYINNNWNIFEKKWSHLLTKNQLEIGYKIVTNFSKIQEELSDTNLTLTHGDIKSPNIFYKKISENNYNPYFIDWQYISHGKGIQDIVFLMIESFDIDKIDLYVPIFKNYYYLKLLENGIKNYSIDEYQRDFINSICYYPFFVAIWFGITDKDDLIDKNFPFFFIQKLFNFIDKFVPKNFL